MVICHFRYAVSARAALLVSDPADSRHRRSLTQVHVAILLNSILQPPGYPTAFVGGAGVSTFLGVPVFGSLATFPGTKFVEKERKRKGNTKAQISSFSRTHGADQGADREEENRNFFHRAATFDA
jgi:hypothetical protein